MKIPPVIMREPKTRTITEALRPDPVLDDAHRAIDAICCDPQADQARTWLRLKAIRDEADGLLEGLDFSIGRQSAVLKSVGL